MDNEFKRLQQLAGIKEIKIQDPTKLNINNLEIGDKLLVKHTDPFVAFVFRVGQVWEVANIDENYEHYRLVNVNTQTSLGFSKRDLSEMIENGVLVYYKEPRVNEIKVKNPAISYLVEEIIDLDKDFFKHTQNLWREEAYELFGEYENNLKNILNLPNVDDIMGSYDNMREYLNTQTPDILNNLKEYLKNTLKTFGKQVDEIKIQNPTIPYGWERLNKEQLLYNIKFLRDEIEEGAVIIDGWEPEDKGIYDVVFLVKVNDQYYVEGWKDDEYQIQEGPFLDEKSARKEVLKQIDFCMDYWKYIQEITVRDPTIPNIVEFGNKNIEEIKKLVGYEGYTIVKTFEKTRDKDAAYAVFSRLINSTNRKIIVISFDPEFFAANYIKTANINKKTIFYVEI
jgi:hypothetical protein